MGYVRVGMELGWGGFDRAKLDMLILIRIPFSFHVHATEGYECHHFSGGPITNVTISAGRHLYAYKHHNNIRDCTISITNPLMS